MVGDTGPREFRSGRGSRDFVVWRRAAAMVLRSASEPGGGGKIRARDGMGGWWMVDATGWVAALCACVRACVLAGCNEERSVFLRTGRMGGHE